MTGSTDEEVISIFKETKALLTGHFILRSGLRSGHFFQCAQVCQHLDKVTILARLLIEKLDCPTPDTIVAPAMGGLVLGQEVARQLNCRFLFLEKVDDKLALRRNFSLSSSDNVLLVEDVVTKGGRVDEALTILHRTNCNICAVTSLVDRSTDELDFGVPFQPLLKLDFPTYDPSNLPNDLKSLNPTKPGS
ncbi:MAG: orotate phosphoribosyltransferase [Opitutales bacterium]|nr:orotate phosphoribosyltransferase [Opitutales bacterium]